MLDSVPGSVPDHLPDHLLGISRCAVARTDAVPGSVAPRSMFTVARALSSTVMLAALATCAARTATQTVPGSEA